MHEKTSNSSSVTLRRAIMWAGLVLAQGILLRGIARPTTRLYVFMLTIAAFIVDQPLLGGKLAAMRWGGLAQTGIILAVGIVFRVVIAL